jgi:hypothetical protein
MRGKQMSYDVAVWVGPKPADDASALKTFEELADRYEESGEAAHPAIIAYIEDLTERFADLTELDDDDIDESPWAVGPLSGNAMGPFLYLPMTYGRLEEALPFVAEAAARHGLVCFDPQTTKLI